MSGRGLLALVASLAGCQSPIEGTWLFSLDRDPDLEGNCPTDTDSIGETRTWVDVYRASEGGVVVLLVEALRGTFDGRTLEASYEAPVEGGAAGEALALAGVLNGGVLVGSFTWVNGATEGTLCTAVYPFEAERLVSPEERYAP